MIDVSYFGLRIHSETHDLCAETSCPISMGDFVLSHTQSLPGFTPPVSLLPCFFWVSIAALFFYLLCFKFPSKNLFDESGSNVYHLAKVETWDLEYTLAQSFHILRMNSTCRAKFFHMMGPTRFHFHALPDSTSI